MSLWTFWQRLCRPSLAHVPVATPPQPAQAGNPLLAWLDGAGLPWRSTRGDLAARFGVRIDNPYQWELVPLDVHPPPLDGMLWPFGFQAFERCNPEMPPERFSTHVWVGNDAEANIRHAAAQLAEVFGAQPILDRYNTRHAAWRWGASLLSLTVWPPGMQSGPKLSNPAHRRDPRLEVACSVSVQTGWRPRLSPQEQSWLDGFVPFGPARNWSSAGPRETLSRVLSAETLLEFMREPPADVGGWHGAFGLSADLVGLIACDDALYVVPLMQVDRFEVTRTLPAKGGGGSILSAVCHTGYSACPAKSVPLAKGTHADDLSEVAAKLAEAARKPLRLADYDYDV